MKLRKILLFPSIMCGLMPIINTTSCNSKVKYDISKYSSFVSFDWDTDTTHFDVLQLTDTHWFAFESNKWDEKFEIIRNTFDSACKATTDGKIDFIVITGDLINEAKAENWIKYCQKFDSLQTPWTVTFGNHDARGYLSMQDVTSILNEYSAQEGSYLIFNNINDNLTGDCNYAINVTDKNNNTKWQLITLDSGRYESEQYIGYDYIHYDQIEWYKQLIEYTTKNEGKIVPSLAFFHVPLVEYLTAAQAVDKGELTYCESDDDHEETVCCPRINTGLFDVMKQLKSTKGCFVGHDHVNYFSVIYQGIMLAYGVKSSKDIYYRDYMIGGRLISLDDDGTFTSKKINVGTPRP